MPAATSQRQFSPSRREPADEILRLRWEFRVLTQWCDQHDAHGYQLPKADLQVQFKTFVDSVRRLAQANLGRFEDPEPNASQTTDEELLERIERQRDEAYNEGLGPADWAEALN